MRRLPGTLFAGRIRTSTLLLMVAFLGVLSLWVSVRPSTEEVAVRHSRTTSQDTDLPGGRDPAAVTRRPTPTPTPTPSAPTTVKNGRAVPVPGTGPAPPPVAPPPDATPGQSSPPARSLSQILPPGQPTPTPTPDAARPAAPPPAYPNAQP